MTRYVVNTVRTILQNSLTALCSLPRRLFIVTAEQGTTPSSSPCLLALSSLLALSQPPRSVSSRILVWPLRWEERTHKTRDLLRLGREKAPQQFLSTCSNEGDCTQGLLAYYGIYAFVGWPRTAHSRRIER